MASPASRASLTQEAAAYLAGRGIRPLGMDTPTPSRDYYEVHHLLQQKPAEVVIVESLANLDALPDNFLSLVFSCLSRVEAVRPSGLLPRSNK